MALDKLPPYPTGNLREWAVQIVDYLANQGAETEEVEPPVIISLRHAIEGNEKAVTDGIVMYDPAIGLPIFSKNGSWYRFDGSPR